jgi:hypothetical protein
MAAGAVRDTLITVPLLPSTVDEIRDDSLKLA